MECFLLTPLIFDLLEKQEPGKGGKIQLTDAIVELNKFQRVFAKQFDVNDST
jgi:UTP--glucose-1-phosphate uridylyltransferase